jgi:hypothetical protein
MMMKSFLYNFSNFIETLVYHIDDTIQVHHARVKKVIGRIRNEK